MKKLFLILFLLCGTLLFSQTPEKIRYKKITQKECVRKKGYRIALKEVISDSRCPEGVTCVWAGEVQFVISVYKDKKFVADETLSSTQRDENNALFSKYLGKNVKSVGVLPARKEGVPVNPKDYYLRIGYVE